MIRRAQRLDPRHRQDRRVVIAEHVTVRRVEQIVRNGVVVVADAELGVDKRCEDLSSLRPYFCTDAFGLPSYTGAVRCDAAGYGG